MEKLMRTGTESPHVTKLKRKLPQSSYPDKICKWCETKLVRTRQSLTEWNLITTCGKGCATNWRWYKCSKAQHEINEPPLPDKFCMACDNLLVRRENEHKQAWIKRNYCSKTCAACGKTRVKVKVPIAELSEELRVGVKRYIPGTPEFEVLAKQYLARGF
jgi:hypothetical protein